MRLGLEQLEQRILLAAAFGAQQVVTTSANGAFSVYACDLDGDGDNDVLSASANDDRGAGPAGGERQRFFDS